MSQRQSLYTASFLVLGSLIGWLAGSGRMDGALNAAASSPVRDPVGRSRRDTAVAQSTQLATTAAPASGSASTQDMVEKPNIIVIMADDVGWMNIRDRPPQTYLESQPA